MKNIYKKQVNASEVNFYKYMKNIYKKQVNASEVNF
jgi:hypothetical protein